MTASQREIEDVNAKQCKYKAEAIEIRRRRKWQEWNFVVM
jgi:hypothetical protein